MQFVRHWRAARVVINVYCGIKVCNNPDNNGDYRRRTYCRRCGSWFPQKEANLAHATKKKADKVSASQEVCRRAKIPSLGFSDTAYAVCKHGPKRLQPFAFLAKLFVDISLFLTYCATCAVYIVFIATDVKEVVDHYHPSVEGWSNQVYMAMLLVPFSLFAQIRELKHLVPLSVIANSTLIVSFGITLYYIFSGIGDVSMEDRTMFNDVSGFPLFFSTVMFAMEGIGTMLPVENSLLKPYFLGWTGILNVGMSVVICLYVVMGLLGYLRFGDDVQANLIGDLPIDDVAAIVAKLCVTVAVFFTCILQYYVPCDITWRKLSPKIPEKYHNLGQVAMRCWFVVFIVAIAVAVPKLNSIINLEGALLLSILGLFIPAAIDIILHLGGNGFGYLKWRLWKDILIIIISLFALGSGSYYAIKQLIE